MKLSDFVMQTSPYANVHGLAYLSCHLCGESMNVRNSFNAKLRASDGETIYEFSEIDIYATTPVRYVGDKAKMPEEILNVSVRQSVYLHSMCMDAHIGMRFNVPYRNVRCTDCDKGIAFMDKGQKLVSITKGKIENFANGTVQISNYVYQCNECFIANAGANFFARKFSTY